MTPEEFRRHGHAVVDWIADYRARVGERPVMAQTAPGDIKARLPAVAARPARAVRGGARRPRHHRHAGAVALAVAGVLRLLPLQRHTRQRARRLRVHRPRRARAGVAVEPGADRSGRSRHRLAASDGRACRTPGRASSRTPRPPRTLLALICARERVTSYALARGGLQAEPHALVVYASAYSHSSVDKAALLAGFGKDNIRHIACDDAFAMRPDALAAAIADDRAAGRVPVRGRRHDRHHHHDRARPGAGDCRGRRRHRHLAPRRCRDGRLGDGAARMPVDVGRRRGGRFAGRSTRTSGSARPSTARSTTCATPSISCA